MSDATSAPRVRNSHRGGILRRYLFRKDFFTKLKTRARSIERRIVRDPIKDLVELIGPARHIIDAGANVGYVSSQLKAAFPGAKIVCVEPTPDTFATLKERLGTDSTFKLRQEAVSESVGTAQLNITANSGVSSLLEHSDYNKAHWAKKQLAPVTVATNTLDLIMAEEGFPEVEVLKLDVEGAELKALAGADKALRAGKIHSLMVEAMLQPMYKGQPLLWDLVHFLEARDYRLYNVYEIAESEIRQALFCNAVFLSPTLRARLVEKHGKTVCGW